MWISRRDVLQSAGAVVLVGGGVPLLKTGFKWTYRLSLRIYSSSLTTVEPKRPGPSDPASSDRGRM